MSRLMFGGSRNATLGIFLLFFLFLKFPYQGIQRRMVLVVIFFSYFKYFFHFGAAICDLVHDVDAIHCLC